MAIAVQSTSTTNYASTSTLTLNKPSGTVDGDLLIATMMSEDRDVNSVPSGWTLLRHQDLIPANHHNVYYKVASSEGASWDWGLAVAEIFGGAVLRIDGQASTFLDVDNSNEDSNNDTPSYTNTITPTLASSMLVMCIASTQAGTGGSSGYAIATDNPTWTEQVDIEASASNLLVATAIRLETSATGNSSVTLPTSASVDSSCIIFNLLQDFSATGTTALLEMNNFTIFAPTSSSGSTVTTALLEMNSTIQSSSATAKDPDWTNQTKNTGVWTNQNKS